MYAEHLVSVWMKNSTAKMTRVGVEEKIRLFVTGDLEYATDALSAVWEIASKDGEIPTRESTLPSVSPV
jgi:hypothetical protein